MFSATKSRITLLAASAAIAAVTGASLISAPTATAAPAAPVTPTKASAATVSITNSLSPEVKRLVKGSGAAAQTRALNTFWTAAKMKSAVSLDAIKVQGSAPAVTRTEPSVSKGAPGKVSGVSPKVTPRVLVKPRISPQYDYPNYPYYQATARTNGKIFFQQGTGYYVCSGAIVNTEGKSSIWTAGHCLFDYGNQSYRSWSYNVTFVPSYSNGYRPYSTWTARQLWVTSAWYYNRDLTQDNGSFTVNRNFGYRIADYLGAQGITWNNTVNWYSNAYGYPQGAPFSGAYLVHAGAYTYQSGNTLYMYSGLTGGSSGGPWLRNFDGSYGLINGHNDFIYTNSPSYMYTPYYGNQVASLYNAVRYATS